MLKLKEELLSPNTTKYHLLRDGEVVSYQDWLRQIQTSQVFSEFFSDALRNSPYEAFFWEVCPTTKSGLNEPFEFVLVNSAHLARVRADSRSFKVYFTLEDQVVTFPNLGGDAQLIVPTDQYNGTNYGHLAAFLRTASSDQVLSLWKKVGQTFESTIGAETRWLSTAGLGEPWLHIRIDSRPKYYRHSNYR